MVTKYHLHSKCIYFSDRKKQTKNWQMDQGNHFHCAKAFPPFWLSRKAGVKNHFFTQKPLYIKWKSRLVENDFEMDRKTEIGQIPQQPKLNSHCSMMLPKNLIWLMFAFYFCPLNCWCRFKHGPEAPVKYNTKMECLQCLPISIVQR